MTRIFVILIICLIVQFKALLSAQSFEYGFDSGEIDRLLVYQPRSTEDYLVGIDVVKQPSFTDTGEYVIQLLDDFGSLIDEVYFTDENENRRCAALFENELGWVVIEDVHDLLDNTTRIRFHQLNSALEIITSTEYEHPEQYSRAVSLAFDETASGDLIMLSTLRNETVNPMTYGYGLYRVNSSLDSVKFSYLETPGLSILYDIMEFSPNDIRIASRGVCHNVQNDFMGSAICVAGFDSLWNPTTSYVPEVQGADQNAGMIADSDSTFLMLWNQNIYSSDWEFTEDYSVYRFDHEYNVLDSIYLGQTQAADTANRVEPDCIDISSDEYIYTASTFRFSIPPFWFLESWIEIYKLNSNLEVEWRRFYGGDAFYYVNSIRATEDGGAIVFSSRSELVDDMDETEIDAYILKVDSEGLLTRLDETDGLRSVTLSFFPNPTTERFNIETDLNDYSVTLRTVDGKLVDSWSNLSASVTLNLSQHASGMYLITVWSQDRNFEYSEQLILE